MQHTNDDRSDEEDHRSQEDRRNDENNSDWDKLSDKSNDRKVSVDPHQIDGQAQPNEKEDHQNETREENNESKDGQNETIEEHNATREEHNNSRRSEDHKKDYKGSDNEEDVKQELISKDAEGSIVDRSKLDQTARSDQNEQSKLSETQEDRVKQLQEESIADPSKLDETAKSDQNEQSKLPETQELGIKNNQEENLLDSETPQVENQPQNRVDDTMLNMTLPARQRLGSTNTNSELCQMIAVGESEQNMGTGHTPDNSFEKDQQESRSKKVKEFKEVEEYFLEQEDISMVCANEESYFMNPAAVADIDKLRKDIEFRAEFINNIVVRVEEPVQVKHDTMLALQAFKLTIFQGNEAIINVSRR